MLIHEARLRHWDEPVAEPHEGEGLPPAAEHSPPLDTAPPDVPFWQAVPAPPNALSDLPPAPQLQAAAETAAAATQTAPHTAPPPATSSAASYAGEPSADPQWLADRERALVAIRADYTAARAQAQSTAGSGPGWTVATTVSDESGQIRSASGRDIVFVADPSAPQVIVGYDESGPVYQPNGQWMEFDEEAFAAHFRAQGGTHLQSLASLYGTDVAGLFTKHPEIWGIATSDHAINAGPPPAGRAMGDPSQLGMLDLYMRDPQMAALIDAYGGQPAPATGDIAREQVRIYGQQRYDQLSRLDNAMASVRSQYTDAMAQAQASGSGPGWIERPRTITVSDESGQTSTQTLYVTDESGQPLRDASGQPQAQMERLFDPDAFTAWYTQQGGLQHEAFRTFYGQSHTSFATDESGRSFAASVSFDNPNWSMYGAGGPMGHKDLLGINPNDPPRLHNRDAVGFDLEAGWATAHGNIRHKRDWFETIVQAAIVGVVSYVSAGTLGPAVAGAIGVTSATGVAVVSAAVAGAAGSLAGGMMNGSVNFKDILRGALAGGLSAGLLNTLTPAVHAAAGPVGTLALRTTVQGGIQALLGGEFKDGALAGFASGLADMAGANMQANIDKAVADGAMTAAEAATARTFARVVGSAIRAAGNPDDPANAFASSFLNDLIQQAGPAPATPTNRLAFDDEGNLMPGIVDPDATPAEQQAQLAAHLQAQGLEAGLAQTLATETILRQQLVIHAATDARTIGGRLVTDEAQDSALDEVNAEFGINPDGDPNLMPVGWLDDASKSLSAYVDRVSQRVGGPLRSTLDKAMEAIRIGRLEQAQQSISSYLEGVAARGGLSEAEIVVLGVLYAANETLFPTTVLDVIPGAGKALGKVGDLIRGGANAREVAAATRIESRGLAEVERAAQVQAARAEAHYAAQGMTVVRETPGQRGAWNDTLNAPLQPSTAYVLANGHSYVTDAAGRVARADATLDLAKLGTGDRNVYQQVVSGRIGGEGYDGGHLIGTLFGGAGERINLVPQLSSVNRGEFRAMEKMWADALMANKSVKVEVNPVYAGGSAVPTEIKVTYWIDGVRDTQVFGNLRGG